MLIYYELLINSRNQNKHKKKLVYKNRLFIKL